MDEFIEKLIGRLEEESYEIQLDGAVVASTKTVIELSEVKEISNELAEEYKISMTNGGCVDCDECEHRSEDCLCDISKNEEECPLVRNNGWIPCDERLPEDDTKGYLVHTTDGFVEILGFTKDAYKLSKYEFEEYKGKKKHLFYDWDSEYGYCECECDAWRPLPAPYNPKGE